MSGLRGALAVAAAALLLAVPCVAQTQSPPRDQGALDAVTSAIMKLPLTTTSADARNHFLQGRRELDLGQVLDANAHFKAAVAADSTFAIGYLNVANTGTSLAEFRTNLERAERFAARASEAERLEIQIARKGLDNDVNGQLVLAQQLVTKYPESPRAHLILAGVQSSLNRHDDARVSMMKAVALAPRLLVAYADLGNSYLFGEPKDFAKALKHVRFAESLAPNEPSMHDQMGDVYRAQNNLDQARAEYTRGHELNPTDASLLQQRGHVNSFAGDYAAARADYDSAIALGRGNERAGFAPYRAYVNLYAGDPQAAIVELNRLVANVDAMNVPEPVGMKISALSDIAVIAIHNRDFASAEQALKVRTPLVLQQATKSGSAAFQRRAEASIAFFDGWLAARRGNYVAAGKAVERVATLVSQDQNPRKLEPVHELRGYIALYQGNFRDASAELAQSNLDDPYVKYQYAVALQRAGEQAKSNKLQRELAVYNFNNVGYALIRKDVQQPIS